MKNLKLIAPLTALVVLAGCFGSTSSSTSVSTSSATSSKPSTTPTTSVVTSSASVSSQSSVSSVSSISSSVFDHKVMDGVAPIFEEELGFYNTGASVFYVDSDTIAVFYTTNEVKNVQGDVIAYREGTLTNGEWVFGERKIVLRPTAGQWDSQRVNNPDVVQGFFSYNNADYSYLMVYSGNNLVADKQYQIGAAVAQNPAGPWYKVGTAPLIAYNAAVYGSTYGAGNPSIISYDTEGMVRLFCTYADEYLTGTRVYDLNLTDLHNIVGLNAYRYVSVQGLEDKDLGVLAMLNNADFTIDPVTQTLVVVRDRNPLASTNPITADSLQVAKADVRILNSIDYQWEIVEQSINDIDTADPNDETSNGWARVFSGAFITDAYGRVPSTNHLYLVYSSSQEASSLTDTTYIFTPSIHQYEIVVG